MWKLASGALLAAAATALSACAGAGDEQASRPCEGPGTGGPRVVYRVEPTPDAPRVTRAGIEQTMEVMCERTRALGARGVRIRATRGGRVVVRLGPGDDATQTAVAIGIPARLTFYDWDENVIGSPDRPVPDLLRAVRRAEAAEPAAEPEDIPASGAEKETVDRLQGDPARVQAFYDRRNDATGPSYYAEAGGRIVAGPETSCAGLQLALAPSERPPRGDSVQGDLGAVDCTRRIAARGLPSGGVVHVVPRGVRVVANSRPGGGDAGGGVGTGATPEGPAGYYVIEDDAALRSDGIAKADERRDELTGATGVRLSFTETGATGFRALTGGIAARGIGRPSGGDGRYAVTLDDQLVSLVAIDPTANPDGLDPGDGAVIGNLGDAARARQVAKLVDAGALPLDVRPAP